MPPIFPYRREVESVVDMIDAYWFGAREENGLVYSVSGNDPGWRDGEERIVDYPEAVRLYRWGYHAADSWLNALESVPGPIACRVRLEVAFRNNDGKMVGPRRLLVEHADASRELRLFAADCAEHALLRERFVGREPDQRSWDAVEVVRQFARGEISAETLLTAYDAARYATDVVSYNVSAYYAANAASSAAGGAAAGAAYAVYAAYITAASARVAYPAVAYNGYSDFASSMGSVSTAAVADQISERAWQSERLNYWMEQAFSRKVTAANA